MKKVYQAPKMELVRLVATDVITTSAPVEDPETVDLGTVKVNAAAWND